MLQNFLSLLSTFIGHFRSHVVSAFSSPFDSHFYTQSAPPLCLYDLKSYKARIVWWLISLLFACAFILPFYMQWLSEICHFGEIPLWLMSIFGLLSIASMLFTPKNRRTSVGFFVGVLWFYWIGLGMRYFDMGILIPFVILLVGAGVAVVFYIGLWCECLIWRFAFLMLLSFLTPLGFDWIVPESVFAYSYVGVDKLSFAFVIIALWAFLHFTRFYKLLALLPLLFALDMHTFDSAQSRFATLYPQTIEVSAQGLEKPLRIKLIQTAVNQNIAYRMQHMDSIFRHYIFTDIYDAIKDGYDVVVLPESAFYVPFDWEHFSYLGELQEMSKKIVIITGALRMEVQQDGHIQYFNSTYKFEKGRMEYIDKVLLVPFGERLPSFLQPLAEKFFEGTGGFSAGKEFEYFEIHGLRFKNALCYEGSSRSFYADKPQFVLMGSNNAWFVPSIEPILQKNLMKYYARLYGSTILHATNLSPRAVVTP